MIKFKINKLQSLKFKMSYLLFLKVLIFQIKNHVFLKYFFIYKITRILCLLLQGCVNFRLVGFTNFVVGLHTSIVGFIRLVKEVVIKHSGVVDSLHLHMALEVFLLVHFLVEPYQARIVVSSFRSFLSLISMVFQQIHLQTLQLLPLTFKIQMNLVDCKLDVEALQLIFFVVH